MTRVPLSTPVARREIFAWCLYDFGDSGFTTVIVTAFYVLYFKSVVVGDPGRGDWYWGLANALSEVVVAALAPILGAIADFSGSKMLFLRSCAVLVAVFTASLFLVGPGMVWAGTLLFVAANVGFAGGGVFIDSFLPELADERTVGRISGFKWALGYVGGMLCLALILPLASGGFAAANLSSARLVFPVVALWYAAATLPTFLLLRERAVARPLPPGKGYVSIGFERLADTFRHVRRYRQLFRFLLAFWIYNDAIVTVIVFAAAYAQDTLGFTVRENLMLLVAVNIPAAAGALGFGRLLDAVGAKRTLILTLLLWLGIVGGAWAADSRGEFFAVASLAGLGLGSCQSASRSLMARFTPPGRSGEFFGFLGLAGKVSAVFGPLVFGWLSYRTGDQRLAMLSVGVFFLAGLLVLLTVDEQEGIQAAAREEKSEGRIGR